MGNTGKATSFYSNFGGLQALPKVCAEVRIGKVGQLFRPQIDTLNTIKGYNALAGLIAGVLFPIADAAKNGLDFIGVGFLDGIP